MSCIANYPIEMRKKENPMILGTEEITERLEKYFQLEKSYLHLPNNKIINLSQEMINEIKERALAILVTGVDLSTDIWAIQWPNKYVVRNFNYE